MKKKRLKKRAVKDLKPSVRSKRTTEELMKILDETEVEIFNKILLNEKHNKL